MGVLRGLRFGGGPFGGGGGNNRGRNNQATEQSNRALKKDKVVAVADQRTSSLIVSASREMMPEIAEMIAQLDSRPARKQKVYISSLENADVQHVEQVVRDNLPGVELDSDSLQTFVKHMLGHERLRPPLVRATIFADRFVPWLPARISKAREGLEGVERHVLTEYLIGSNFFRVPDPRGETIVYHGAVIACINPFTHASGPKLSDA